MTQVHKMHSPIELQVREQNRTIVHAPTISIRPVINDLIWFPMISVLP